MAGAVSGNIHHVKDSAQILGELEELREKLESAAQVADAVARIVQQYKPILDKLNDYRKGSDAKIDADRFHLSQAEVKRLSECKGDLERLALDSKKEAEGGDGGGAGDSVTPLTRMETYRPVESSSPKEEDVVSSERPSDRVPGDDDIDLHKGSDADVSGDEAVTREESITETEQNSPSDVASPAESTQPQAADAATAQVQTANKASICSCSCIFFAGLIVVAAIVANSCDLSQMVHMID